MPPVVISIVAVAIAVITVAILSFSPFARGDNWRATVTPLASIIGSGFLICGPILANEFGSAALLAEAVLLAIAYAVGAVVRFNIVHVENHARALDPTDRFALMMRAGQVTLAISYAVSVAYYLKLLAEFMLKALPVPADQHGLVSNLLVTFIIICMTALTFSGDIKRIEQAAHASVSVKLGIIAGLLAGLALWWATHASVPLDLPPARIGWNSIPLLLGLLITVQGFETSRYMGDSYDQPTRVLTMRRAQWISTVIYLGFVAMLTPFLRQAQSAEGVAGILDIMELVAPIMGMFVLIGAVSSQLSAAIADSIGSGGLIEEVSGRRLAIRGSFIMASGMAIAVVWLTDPFEVVALSSRAFAVFYAVQAVLAFWVSRRTGAGGVRAQAGFILVGLVCIVAAAAGAPAEG